MFEAYENSDWKSKIINEKTKLTSQIQLWYEIKDFDFYNMQEQSLGSVAFLVLRWAELAQCLLVTKIVYFLSGTHVYKSCSFVRRNCSSVLGESNEFSILSESSS